MNNTKRTSGVMLSARCYVDFIFENNNKILNFFLKKIENYLKTNLYVIQTNETEQLIHKDSLKYAKSLNWCIKNAGVLGTTFSKFQLPDEPFLYQVDIKKYGTGSDFFDKQAAMWKALGEYIERYLWSESSDWYKNTSVKSTIKDIGPKGLKLSTLAGFSSKQKKNHDQLNFTEDTLLSWTKCNLISPSKGTIYCPTQILSSQYTSKKNSEPLLRWSITTGLATSQNLKGAITAGLLECIERDAFMISYLNKLPLQRLDLDFLSKQNSKILHVVEEFKKHQLKPYVFKMATDFDVHAYMGLIIDEKSNQFSPLLTLGARASFDPNKSILDSLSEAQVVRNYLRNSGMKKELDKTKVLKHKTRLIYWAQKKSLNDLDFLFKENDLYIPEETITPTEDKQYKIVTNQLKELDYQAFYKELTTITHRPLKLRTVMTVVPKLQPMHLDESFPYFGGERIKSVPIKLGYPVSKSLNTEPHPFP
jgi:ribosomal protein S12 methylthiotransferase accessory factor